MIESTLLKLLKRFDKQMLKDFNVFVKSPYYNTNKAVIKLFEYIRKQYPDYKPEKLEKEFVYKKLFGKTQYNDGFLRVLMSSLQSVAEEYLTNISISRHTLLKKKYLLDELSLLGERKLAEKIINQEIKSFEDTEPQNPDDFLDMYHIAFYKKYYYSTQFVVSKGNIPDEKLLDEQKYLIFHFLLRTLANHFYHLNQQNVINYQPNLHFLDEITGFLKKNPEYLESPILNITYLRVMLLKNNSIEDYYRLKNAFYATFDRLSVKDSFNTISIIINFCQKNYFVTDDELYQKEKFEILKFAVENDLNTFDDSDGFDAMRFNMIVSMALEFDEIKWAEDFVENYSSQLDDSVKEYKEIFARAMIFVEKGEFEDALSELAGLKNPKSASDKFNLRMLLLRIFYEQKFFDQAESAADSFRHLIQNDKVLPDAYKESYRNFYSLFVKLLNLRLKNETSGGGDLKKQISEMKPVIQKKWLLKKTDELS